MAMTVIGNGTVTSPLGFSAGAAAAGIKYEGRTDLAVLASTTPCTVAGVFTQNAVQSAPVQVSRRKVASGTASAVIANSGCANACTGERGIADAEEMCALTAQRFGFNAAEVLVASTGVVGTFMPVNRVKAGLEAMTLDSGGGDAFARAIMTTDTVSKQTAMSVDTPAGRFTIGGAAKGSGMIHPNMGTMLCFITTDARVDPSFLQDALKRIADRTLNMVSIDGDTSPSDTLVVLANGQAANAQFDESNGRPFEEALWHVCEHLAKSIAADGEGATKLIEVTVLRAMTIDDARTAARTVAGSSLVKAAIHGADPNWGRVASAVGRSGATVDAAKMSLGLNGVTVMSSGMPVAFEENRLRQSLGNSVVTVNIDLNVGAEQAIAWGCDLSSDYVTINASYTT